MAWLELPLSQSFSAVLAGPSVGPWWLGLAADLTRALGLSLAGQVHLQPRCSQKWWCGREPGRTLCVQKGRRELVSWWTWRPILCPLCEKKVIRLCTLVRKIPSCTHRPWALWGRSLWCDLLTLPGERPRQLWRRRCAWACVWVWGQRHTEWVIIYMVWNNPTGFTSQGLHQRVDDSLPPCLTFLKGLHTHTQRPNLVSRLCLTSIYTNFLTWPCSVLAQVLFMQFGVMRKFWKWSWWQLPSIVNKPTDIECSWEMAEMVSVLCVFCHSKK